jgi:hypothetical protein
VGFARMTDHGVGVWRCWRFVERKTWVSPTLRLLRAKPLAGQMDVDAVWCFSSTPLSGLVEKEAATNIKRTWVNHARARDWMGAAGEGKAFLRAATEVKTAWVPYGE